MSGDRYPAHGVFTFDNDVVFSSNFDNGNLARVERVGAKPYEFRIWTAADNMGTSFQSKHNAWFHFVVTGLPPGVVLRITIVNASPHSGLYKHDMVSCCQLSFVSLSLSLSFHFSFSSLLFQPSVLCIVAMRRTKSGVA